MRKTEVARRIGTTQGSWLHIGSCAAAQVGWEVTVGVIVHDKRSNLRQKGAGNGQLRHELRTRFWTIYRQGSINDVEVGGRVEFKFKGCYKTFRASSKVALGCLRIEQAQIIECRVLLPSSSVDTMTAARTRVRFAEVTMDHDMAHEEPREAVTVPKVSKSPRMLRP